MTQTIQFDDWQDEPDKDGWWWRVSPDGTVSEPLELHEFSGWQSWVGDDGRWLYLGPIAEDEQRRNADD